jgi:hypothetical protein
VSEWRTNCKTHKAYPMRKSDTITDILRKQPDSKPWKCPNCGVTVPEPYSQEHLVRERLMAKRLKKAREEGIKRGLDESMLDFEARQIAQMEDIGEDIIVAQLIPDDGTTTYYTTTINLGAFGPSVEAFSTGEPREVIAKGLRSYHQTKAQAQAHADYENDLYARTGKFTSDFKAEHEHGCSEFGCDDNEYDEDAGEHTGE